MAICVGRLSFKKDVYFLNLFKPRVVRPNIIRGTEFDFFSLFINRTRRSKKGETYLDGAFQMAKRSTRPKTRRRHAFDTREVEMLLVTNITLDIRAIGRSVLKRERERDR